MVDWGAQAVNKMRFCKTAAYILGLFVILCGILCSIYLSGYLLFLKPIIDIVRSLWITTEKFELVLCLALLKIACAIPVGWVIMYFGVILGKAFCLMSMNERNQYE